MSPISLYEDGYGNVVDENDSPEPMDTSLTRMSLWLRRLPTHFECLRHAACGESSQTCPMLVEESKEENTRMREANIKRDYVCYTFRDKARFFRSEH